MPSPHLVKLGPTSGRSEYLCKSLGILLYRRRLVASPPFIHSFIFAWTQLFSALAYSPILLIYLIAQIVLTLAVGSVFSGLLVPLT